MWYRLEGRHGEGGGRCGSIGETLTLGIKSFCTCPTGYRSPPFPMRFVDRAIVKQLDFVREEKCSFHLPWIF